MRVVYLSFLLCLVAFAAVTQTHSSASYHRTMRCEAATPDELAAWQKTSRDTLVELLKIDEDLMARTAVPPAADTTIIKTTRTKKYVRHDLLFEAAPNRRIPVVLTIPTQAREAQTPAVICIHSHSVDRENVYKPGMSRAFGRELAERGFVTLSTDVGQHQTQSLGSQTLIGERLSDLLRLVDLAQSLREVDSARIGCAGLSLGGEMAMWLGAMDTRIAAVVSSGFLTTMENLRRRVHCQCWDFPGLQSRFDFADIYALISPRPLLCQIGKLEGPDSFPVRFAQQAMAEIEQAYAAAGHSERARLEIHPGGHVFHLPSALGFFRTHLQTRPERVEHDGVRPDR